MKAVGRNLIINVTKEGTTKTKGGLLLAETAPSLTGTGALDLYLWIA